MTTLYEKLFIYFTLAITGYVVMVLLTGFSPTALFTYVIVLAILSLRLPWRD